MQYRRVPNEYCLSNGLELIADYPELILGKWAKCVRHPALDPALSGLANDEFTIPN